MNSSLSSKDITMTKCSPVIRTSLFKRNISLPIVDDKYSFTSARNVLALLVTSIESLEHLSCWYNISDNGKGSLYELFGLEDCVCLSIMRTCGLIRHNKVNRKTSFSVETNKWIIFLNRYELINIGIIMSTTSIVIDNKTIRKNMTSIRIGTKSLSSYLKSNTQCNHQILPPIIKMRQLSHYFLDSISIYTLKEIYWSED